MPRHSKLEPGQIDAAVDARLDRFYEDVVQAARSMGQPPPPRDRDQLLMLSLDLLERVDPEAYNNLFEEAVEMFGLEVRIDADTGEPVLSSKAVAKALGMPHEEVIEKLEEIGEPIRKRRVVRRQ
ncbi:MAG: hypothetical protein JO095_10595 [Alphaproteobacteria bacterium]|nr:hypothetical protein [Alphaproteobacteria bacterium]